MTAAYQVHTAQLAIGFNVQVLSYWTQQGYCLGASVPWAAPFESGTVLSGCQGLSQYAVACSSFSS